MRTPLSITQFLPIDDVGVDLGLERHVGAVVDNGGRVENCVQLFFRVEFAQRAGIGKIGVFSAKDGDILALDLDIFIQKNSARPQFFRPAACISGSLKK